MPLLIQDLSKRSQTITRPFWATVVAVLLIFVGGVWWVGANMKYNATVNASSTPIGTEIQFSQTGAQVTLSGIYTDRDQDALVVRLTPDDKAQQLLPYQGDQFAVFAYADSVKKYKELPILFGKMSTDGDYFLVLPKPSDDVYSFMVVNTNPVVGSAADNQKELESNMKRRITSQEGQESVAKELSDFNDNAVISGNSKEDKNGKKEQATSYDRIGFRVTLDPARKEQEYQPTTINENLMKGENFQFNVLFDQVLKNTAIEELTREYNDQNVVTSQWKDEIERLNDRIAYNPNDEAAEKQLQEAEDGLEKAQKRQDQIVDEITRYQALEYDDNFFQSLQDTATVVKP